MKRMVFSLSFLLFVSGMYAQITLEECQRKTQENYPLVHQYGLVEKTKEYNLCGRHYVLTAGFGEKWL